MGLMLWELKARQCPKWKDMSQGHYDIVVPFARSLVDIRGRASQSGRNGGTPVGFMEKAFLRREYVV
jgi:hypothetical protein